jgi:hypothetical protein
MGRVVCVRKVDEGIKVEWSAEMDEEKEEEIELEREFKRVLR